MVYRLSQIAEKLGVAYELKGPDFLVTGLATLQNATADKVSFLAQPKYRHFLEGTQAGAVMIRPEEAAACPVSVLLMNDPHVGFAKLAALFDETPVPLPGIHPTAVIDPSVKVPASASIGPGVVIEAGVVLGEGVVIGAGSVIGAEARIGAATVLKPRVVLYHRVIIGARCLIHSGAVLGSDGFGFANEGGRWLKVPQLGTVELADEVEIGANTTIDRGAIDNTRISRGVKIDNQVQIAHNVVIGESTAIAAQAGIAGSSELGRHCLLGGKVGVNGHIRIADEVMVTAMSGISNNIDVKGVYSASIPAKPVMEWNKALARLYRLEQLMSTVKVLKAKLLGGDTGE
jgi:UDP-3-O-[3-hydroxymyristoyl] glucosamine N-acyltransferase